MEAHLVACVNESLAAFLYDNASFLCERLVASSPTQVRSYFTALDSSMLPASLCVQLERHTMYVIKQHYCIEYSPGMACKRNSH